MGICEYGNIQTRNPESKCDGDLIKGVSFASLFLFFGTLSATAVVPRSAAFVYRSERSDWLVAEGSQVESKYAKTTFHLSVPGEDLCTWMS